MNARRAGATTIVLIALTVASALVPDAAALHSNPAGSLLPPSATHLLGTDELGRDVAVRILAGAKDSLLVGVASMALGTAIGVVFGIAAGLAPKSIDHVISRVIDTMAAFPGILLCLVLIAFTGPGTGNLILALGIVGAPRYARLVRAETHVVRTSGYIEQAPLLGNSRIGTAARHILPNVLGAVPTLAAIGVGTAILASSTLSFLGLGVQPPQPEWGAMLAEGRSNLNDAWWLSAFPGIAIVVTVLLFAVLGRSLGTRSSTPAPAPVPRTEREAA